LLGVKVPLSLCIRRWSLANKAKRPMTQLTAARRAAERATTTPSIRYETKLDALFEVLDAVAWLSSPTPKEIAQFANIAPRASGKILKNARLIGLAETPDDCTFVLATPYPFKVLSIRKERCASASDTSP
jgi:hypothetical protein